MCFSLSPSLYSQLLSKKVILYLCNAEFWIESFKSVGISVILAFRIRTFVAEAHYIPSGSMLPTLEISDRLIIDKINYDFTHPQWGDIVVFNPTLTLEQQNFHNPTP
jgi:signal peptidase I